MPNWKVHVMFGIVFTALFYFLITHFNDLTLKDLKFFLYIPIIFFFVQLPDIDSQSSFIRRMLTVLGIAMTLGFLGTYFFVRNLFFIVAATMILIILGLTYLLKHRGVLHSVMAGFFLSLPLIVGYDFVEGIFFFNYTLFLVGFIGYVSHLVIDEELTLFG